MHSLIIFDSDGVLVDSEIISNRIMAQSIRSVGGLMTDEEVLSTYIGGTMVEVIRDVESRIGRSLPTDWLQTFEKQRADAFRLELKAIDGVKEVVQLLSRKHVPFCVASQAKVEKTQLTLGLTGLLEFFNDHIFSSTMVPRPKPFPDLFLYAAQKFAVPSSECVVIEDSAKGVTAAVAAGMKVFGYAPKTGDASSLSRAGAQVFDEMRNLPYLLGL